MRDPAVRGSIRTLFLDIGGVLISNGWGHDSRLLAVERFSLDKEEFEYRHDLFFETFELGELPLDEYLQQTVFYKPRSFSLNDLKDFIFSCSLALPGSIALFKRLKKAYNLKVIAVSNEGREFNEFRIEKFQLDDLFDAYVSSCYVHLRKPNKQILQLACDIAHTIPACALYIDNDPILVDVASRFGLHSLQFQGVDSIEGQVAEFTFCT